MSNIREGVKAAVPAARILIRPILVVGPSAKANATGTAFLKLAQHFSIYDSLPFNDTKIHGAAPMLEYGKKRCSLLMRSLANDP